MKQLASDYETVGEEPSSRFSIDLLDIFIVIAKRKKLILRNTLIAMAVAVVVLLLMKNTYEATAVILPPHQEQSISSLLSGQLGSLASISGSGSLGSGLLKNPNDIYEGLLLSRTVTSRIVDKYNLKDKFHKKLEQDAIKALLAHTTITLSKDSLIRIGVTTNDPNFSSQLANAFVDELHDLNTNLALTDSSQRRAFFQQQLDNEKVVLANAEANFQEVEKKTGMVMPTSQVDMAARNVASLRSQISAREAQLESVKTFATDQNPQYLRFTAQLNSLRDQLAQLESSQKSMTPGDIEIPTSRLPEASKEYITRFREVRLQEAVYELLVKQFEAAKIDEAKTAPMIQVVDRAVPPEHKTGPPRSLITLGIGFFVFAVSSLWYVLSYGYSLARKDAAFSSKLTQLKSSLSRN